MFIDVCQVQGLDITKYPPSSVITIVKFGKASIMSDNNNTALKVSSLLIASVKEAVVRVHGDWGELSMEAKHELIHMIKFTCRKKKQQELRWGRSLSRWYLRFTYRGSRQGRNSATCSAASSLMLQR